jgi:hypothetical protein
MHWSIKKQWSKRIAAEGIAYASVPRILFREIREQLTRFLRILDVDSQFIHEEMECSPIFGR